MSERGKRITVSVAVIGLTYLFAWVLITHAQVGPDTITHPEATATQCAAATPVAGNQTTLLSASTSNPPSKPIADRLCYVVQNFSTTNAAMVGDAVSATQGIALNPVPAAQPSSVGAVGDSATVCVTTKLNACGVGGSAVVGVTEVVRP